MIDLLPVPQDRFLCPCGAGPLTNEGFFLPGMMPLARTVCANCRRRFLSHLHVGFCHWSDLAIEETTGTLHNGGTIGWYANELDAMSRSRGRPAPKVEMRGSFDAQGRDVVIVNTLDPTYGHNIARLFAISSIKRLFPDAAIVVIAARFTAWLVPEGVAQIWIVDAPLRELHLANDAIDANLQTLMRQAARLRYAPLFYGNAIRIEDFSKQRPFEPQGIDDLLPTRLTYNWREDRCWTHRGRSLPSQEAVAEQLWLATKLFERLRQEVSDLQVTVTGYGRYGEFPNWVEDLRIVEQTDAAEREWMRRYARSHVAIGVHGSNMHLPSAHAAGSIEIVPTDLWNNCFDTWEWVNHIPSQIALGRYLKIPHSTSLSEMASIAFILLRRMQAQAAYHLIGRIADLDQRDRLLMQTSPIMRGGHALAIVDDSGQPL